MTKKMMGMLAVAGLVFGMVACGAPAEGGDNSGGLNAYQVPLPEGGTVTCVYTGSMRGSVDCNWDEVN